MAALAKASARTDQRPQYCATQYSTDRDWVRSTTIRRPDPQLPFDDEGDTLYAAWQEAVKRTVDHIFEQQGVE
jgi:hypothetical protein